MDEVRAQPGQQEKFLATTADIAIYGGAAGGGKTWALLIEPTRNLSNPGFGAVILRRTTTEIRKEGGMWDESMDIYSALNGTPREHLLDWHWDGGGRVSFAHMEYEKNRFDWKGAQIPLICFDQIEDFTARQFWYMLSRNRSTCGVKPYIRATANPDPDSFVAKFIEWWIDEGTGYPIPERDGVIRYFIRRNDEIFWGDSEQELVDRFGKDALPKSVTFIKADIYDNPALLDADPGYLANLQALDHVERERLEKGNWKIRPAGGLYFRRSFFEVVDAAPVSDVKVRYWDLAATEERPGTDPDWSAGVKVSRSEDGIFYVEHVERFRASPHKVETAIRRLAEQDTDDCAIGLSQDPGQAGKAQVLHLVRSLAGYYVQHAGETGDKVTRAGPASSQAEAGNIKVVRGQWNDQFFLELENFPEGAHDDQVDALAGAIRILSKAAPLEVW